MVSRRDFLKYVGFSTAAAALAGCEAPVHKAIPYLVQPEEVVPGEANYYATCIADGFDFASVLVKTREGRPIAVLRNPEAKAGGAVNARVLASVLGLYDENRGGGGDWESFNRETIAALERAKAEGKQIVFLTQTLASPSSYALLELLKEQYPTLEVMEYNTVSEEAAIRAYGMRHIGTGLPDYDFSKAKLIVSFGADFLGDWNGGGYEADYAKGRIPSQTDGMSRHIQLEANITLTGANADERIALTPSMLKKAFAYCYHYLTSKRPYDEEERLPLSVREKLQAIIAEVRKAGKEALVITGIDSYEAQFLAIALNEQLHSAAFQPQTRVLTRKGYLRAFQQGLLRDMKEGRVGVLFINNLNPLYSLPNAEEFAEALKKVPFSVAFAMRADETALQTTHFAPQPHYLESWGDVQFKRGYYGLMQPCIRPLFNTQQWQDSCLQWLGRTESYYDFVKAHWEARILEGTSWEQALHDGTFVREEPPETEILIKEYYIESMLKKLSEATSEAPFELILYTSTALGDGQQANNPWLQELPDPLTRATWDNYLCMHPADAAKLGIRNWQTAGGALEGDKATVTVKGKSLTVPVYIQPLQAEGSVALALGYGRKAGIQPEMQVGVNAYPLYIDFKKEQPANIVKAEGTHSFACAQVQSSLAGRDNVLKELTLAEFAQLEKPAAAAKDPKRAHHFKISIDLNACVGCAACVIACHAENNVPVVGKEEVRNSRDMHWLRIDRYITQRNTANFQPVMCQHCEEAPCETVCPVGATVHGAQGQNQMAYNRCVGTRYCANNCPYKVRRFNWFQYSENDAFNYNMNNDLGRMVLNPDITVRSRGVMEKCSLCIQNTQAVILKAKKEGRAVAAGEFNNVTACAAACSTGAIKFGDANEEGSEIAQLTASERMYHLLEQLGTQPNVVYQAKTINN